MWEVIKNYFNIGKIGRPDWLNEETPEARALAYCIAEMKYYEDWGRHNRIHWKIWQNIAILAGVIATIVAVLPLDEKNLGALAQG